MRLRNENEDKTKTQVTQSLNQYSEKEGKIWLQNISNHVSVSSSCLRSYFVISLIDCNYMVRLIAHSFVLMLRYCANLKAIRYESTSLNRIVADKSHRVIVVITALTNFHSKTGYTF